MAPKRLRDVPYSCIHELSSILDSSNNDQNWRALASKYGIYSTTQICVFERCEKQSDGSPTRALLNDLAMTDRNVDELFTLLYKLENKQAFDFLKKSGQVSKSLANSLKLSDTPNHVQQPRPSGMTRSIMQSVPSSYSPDFPPASNDVSLSFVAKAKDSMTDDILIALRNKGLVEFSYGEVCQATNQFNDSTTSCKLGMGSFGTVYKGNLKNTTFAIKKLNLQSDLHARSVGLSQFAVEVVALSKYRHPNLLELVGYSLDPKAPCLVYYYMEKGSLASVLAGPDSIAIPWATRLRIAEDTAKGLVYLHTATEKPLIHRDLKSANVLLTNDYQAKIGDFGLARLGSDRGNSMVMTNRLQGTMGYISPEAARGHISTKTDCYSYGVLLLELITNLCAFDSARGYEAQSLVGLVDAQPNKPHHLVSRKGVPWPVGVASEFLEIAQSCSLEHDIRPTSSTLLERVSRLRESSTEDGSWVRPSLAAPPLPRKPTTSRRTVLVLTGNRFQSEVVQGRLTKILGGDTSTSSLRTLPDSEFYFVTLYDAIVIVCSPVADFAKCLQDSINRFNPHLILLTGLCDGVRGRVSLCDLVVCEEVPLRSVTYTLTDSVRNLLGRVEKSASSGSVLWQLPGLLTRSREIPASQVLLWISRIILEIQSAEPLKSEFLASIDYDHSLGYDTQGFLKNMATYHHQYPCLHSANMALIYDEENSTVSVDPNLKAAVLSDGKGVSLRKRRLSPAMRRGIISPVDLPYEPGTAFHRAALCPEGVLGCDTETIELYRTCSISGTPCLSLKSVFRFADPYEDARFDRLAMDMSALGVTQFIGSFLSS